MKINNATFQIKLTQTPHGISKTHEINSNDMGQVFFPSNRTKLGRHQN